MKDEDLKIRLRRLWTSLRGDGQAFPDDNRVESKTSEKRVTGYRFFGEETCASGSCCTKIEKVGDYFV